MAVFYKSTGTAQSGGRVLYFEYSAPSAAFLHAGFRAVKEGSGVLVDHQLAQKQMRPYSRRQQIIFFRSLGVCNHMQIGNMHAHSLNGDNLPLEHSRT